VLGLLAFTRAAPDLIFIGYETGIEVSDEQLACINCTPAAFHGEWNYAIRPRE